MTWLRLDDGFTDHPKVAALSPRAFQAHVTGMAYCARNLTDGFIPARKAKDIAGEALPELVAKPRQGKPLWTKTGTEYEIHDYLDYNPTRESVLAERARNTERKARSRHGVSHGVTPDGTDGVSPNAPVPVSLDPEPIPSREKRNGLPPCLSQEVQYGDAEPVTIASVIRSEMQAKWGMQSPADIGAFDAIVASSCFPGCEGSLDQAYACQDVISKAIEKASGNMRGSMRLIDKIMTEDRGRV